MKKVFTFCFLLFSLVLPAQEGYKPSPENLQARNEFENDRFGMFIHWGLSSVLGDGEWVMNNRKIDIKSYSRLLQLFNPQQYNPEDWVLAAKNAGMKYIVFVSRHHDGFSNWDTKFSDWKITNTPYGRDALKMLAAACKKHDMKLGLYYSTLDWYRSDYPYETGRTGQHSGRTAPGNYGSYLQFMKNQLTELLTNYGPIMSIWFDGHWDQTNPEGHADRSSRIDWKYDEIYGLIHKLQPATLIGNNHHLDPLPGEDFQMFERDLPGDNKSGLSFQKAADHLPVETCETINGAWGFNLTDNNFKSRDQLVQMLAGAAGRNANLLLNVGPMPNGVIQKEFTDTLARLGEWTKLNGPTIYNTRGKIMPVQDWGVVTSKNNRYYVHILKEPTGETITVTGIDGKVKEVSVFGSGENLRYRQGKKELVIHHRYSGGQPDYILEVVTR